MTYCRRMCAALLLLPMLACTAMPSPPTAVRVGRQPSRALATPAHEDGTAQCKAVPRGPKSEAIAALDELNDVERLAIWRDQKPSPGFHQRRALHRKWTADWVRTATVFTHRVGQAVLLDSAMPGCDEQILSTDGRICPSAVMPGRDLSPSQIAGIVASAQLPRPNFVLRCEFNPHHSFVFYDKDGAAAADLRVCFECNEWSWNDGPPEQMPTGATEYLLKMCRELGLGACPSQEPEEEASARFHDVYRAWLFSGAPERPSLAFDIPVSRRLRDMAALEKRKLCAWRILETRSPDGGGLEFGGGRSFRFLTYNECVAHFPDCEETLGDVERADFHQTPDFRFAASPECLEKWALSNSGRCLWGIEERAPSSG